MNPSERRRFNRARVELDTSFKEVGVEEEQLFFGKTVNVSPGGLYLQTSAETFKADNIPKGTLFRVELTIPAEKGLLEFGGRISGFAKVLRTSNLHDTANPDKCGVGFEFCHPVKLSI